MFAEKMESIAKTEVKVAETHKSSFLYCPFNISEQIESIAK